MTIKKKMFYSLMVLFLIGLLLTHFYAPRIITEIRNPIVQLIKGKTAPKEIKEEGFKIKKIQIKSFDDITLTAYFTATQRDTAKATIIFLHGIRANKEHFMPLSKRLAALGFNAVALDSRAHGESGGQHCTFGVKEKKDIQQLINYLQNELGVNNEIGVWGQSLGGAIGLQAMGFDDRIRFGIIESTFSDFRTITHDYVQYFTKFNVRFFTNYMVSRAGKIADFNPDEARPKESCEKINQSILVVHGTEDQRISIKYGKENFDQIKSTNKQFLGIKKANHLNVWRIGGEAYFETVIQFIEKNID